MSALRPLPPSPSLEFEHKEAKALLRRLRAGDPDALARARARHSAMDASEPTRIRLADAQLVIAREYGFASWPRLVRYFGEVARQQYYYKELHRRDFYDGSVRGLIVSHRERRVWGWRPLAAYVPRFYGLSAEEIFTSSVTEDDARLAVARSNGFPSWDALLERTATERPLGDDGWGLDPIRLASTAIESGNLDELKRVVGAHPDLLGLPDRAAYRGRNLVAVALVHERALGVDAMRPIMDWLATQGLDLQRELNTQLCGRMYMKIEAVSELLDRGADPNWIAPNGYSVLEHALLRYWNGEVVDLIVSRTTPPKALWIAAGLGDVDGVRRFLDAKGKPTRAARRHRPPFDAISHMNMPSHPDPDDEEILMEAFVVALLNQRAAVLEYMVSRGFNVDSLVYGTPVINIAVGNGMTSMVESLVRCGASLDIRGWMPSQTARELARDMFANMSQDPDRRRIVELCGMDPDTILAERDTQPRIQPGVAPKLQEALELAGDDAFRLGQSDIRPENLLFGLLRSGGLPLVFFTRASEMNVDRFREDVRHRVLPAEDRVERPKLPFDPDAQAIIQTATAIATELRREVVTGVALLYALVQAEDGPASRLLQQYGSSAAILIPKLKKSL